MMYDRKRDRLGPRIMIGLGMLCGVIAALGPSAIAMLIHYL